MIRKFDKKAAQLMGVGADSFVRASTRSSSSSFNSTGSSVWESVEGSLKPDLPFHIAGGGNVKRNTLKKPRGLSVDTTI